jgi:hypothetical protein
MQDQTTCEDIRGLPRGYWQNANGTLSEIHPSTWGRAPDPPLSSRVSSFQSGLDKVALLEATSASEEQEKSIIPDDNKIGSGSTAQLSSWKELSDPPDGWVLDVENSTEYVSYR